MLAALEDGPSIPSVSARHPSVSVTVRVEFTNRVGHDLDRPNGLIVVAENVQEPLGCKRKVY